MSESSSQNHNSAVAVAEARQQPPSWERKSQYRQPAHEDPRDEKPQGVLQKLRSIRIDLGPGRKDILSFTNQLAVMVRAGISIQDSLDAIAQQCPNKKLQVVIFDLKSRIEAGESFSQALAQHPDVFSNLYINMVAAAEVSGSLSDMLQKLAGYLDAEAETRSQVKGAMVYPIIIAVMAVLVVTFLLTWVLPRFTAIFAGKEHLLPTSTKILLATSIILRSYWFLILPGLGAVIAGFLYYVNTASGRSWWDKMKLRLPLIKTLCQSLYITRSLHTMGVLTRAGVPILNTISITAQIAGNTLYKKMWLGVYEEVRQGKKIASSLLPYDLMPPNVVQMIRCGEDSGTMSDVLRDVSDFYGRELKTVIKAVTSMIEPAMIVMMGFLVGFIAMSIILPIFKMSSAVTGK
jgi:type IV pilus assembly protein PilC